MINRFCIIILCLILLFCTGKTLSAQQKELNSYDFLERQIQKETIATKKQKIVSTLIQKAKNDNELIKLYHYYFLGYDNFRDDRQVKYTDSMVRVATQLKDNDKIGEAFLASGIAHSLKGRL